MLLTPQHRSAQEMRNLSTWQAWPRVPTNQSLLPKIPSENTVFNSLNFVWNLEKKTS